MQRPPELVAVDVAGVGCRLGCAEPTFRARLAERYADFGKGAAAAIALSVAVTEPAVRDPAPGGREPFARIGGGDGVLTIEGAGFRGEFDERTGEGWIAQPPDPAPLETFLTAICAGRLLRQGGMMLHAAALLAEEGARVFFGPSGSGKSTVSGLVGSGVVTDEIVALLPSESGYRVAGVPWRGTPEEAPLAALFDLKKASATAFRRLGPVEVVRRLLPCVFFSRADQAEIEQFLGTAGELARRVPAWEMRFAPEPGFWRAIPALQEGGGR